ncbi:MAG: tetratricopeptide repeat protein, partial [Campylobacterota bacterium]|nr:tetratricopeptide repeat protein [Campylobacterota bacterium]
RLLYSQKDYSGALKIFNEFENSSIDPKRVDFYKGRCNYETKNYEQALAAYERVLMKEPDNLRVRLELAQTYLKLNLPNEAKKEYNYVLEQEIPSNVRNNIEIQLAAIEQSTKRNFINVTAIFGIGYDSNIENGTDAGQYSVFVPQLNSNTPIKSQRQIGTMTYEVGAVLNHIYKVNSNFFVKNGGTLYMQRFQNHNDKDMQIFSVNTTPTYTKDKNMYSVGLFLDHVWYGHVNYLNNYAVMPKYSRSLSETLLYDVYGRYAKKAFYEANQDRDSNTFEFSNKLSYVNKDFGFFAGQIILGNEIKTRGQRTDVSRRYYNLRAFNTYNFTTNLLLNTNINYENYYYQLQDVNFLNKRHDQKMLYSVGLMSVATKSLTLNLNAQYIRNLSNQTPFDYDKYIVKSSLYYSF